jgi:drug/metabolite transporter (DMT)-like permease
MKRLSLRRSTGSLPSVDILSKVSTRRDGSDGLMDARRRDYVFVVLASIFWGTAYPGTKLIVAQVDPLFITAARLGIGALVGFAILALMRRLNWAYLKDPLVWVLGLMNAVAFNLQNVGLFYTTASKTALLVNVNIVLIAILMAVIYKERIGLSRASGIALGVVGVVVLATHLDLSTLAGGEFAGDLLVFSSGVVWAFYLIGMKKEVDHGGDYIALTAMVLGTTALFALVPLFFVSRGYPPDALSWGAIAYLGLVPTFLPFLLYTLSLRTISPTISSLLVLLEIVVASVLSVLMFHDVLDASTLLGGGCIMLGTYITTIGEEPIPAPVASGLAPIARDPPRSGSGGLTRP